MREIDRRIRFLSKRLDGAVVVKQEEGAHLEVRFGARVQVIDENEKKSSYLIVGPDEANPAEGKISFQSPLGTAPDEAQGRGRRDRAATRSAKSTWKSWPSSTDRTVMKQVVRRRLLRLLLALVTTVVLVLAALFIKIIYFPPRFAVVSIATLPAYQDPTFDRAGVGAAGGGDVPARAGFSGQRLDVRAGQRGQCVSLARRGGRARRAVCSRARASAASTSAWAASHSTTWRR